MQSHRNNPDGEENQMDSRQNERDRFAAIQEVKHARSIYTLKRITERLRDLQDEKNQLSEEKQTYSSELTKLNADLKSFPASKYGTPEHERLLELRCEMVDNATGVDAELGTVGREYTRLLEIQQTLRIRQSYVVQLVAAYIAAGSTEETSRITLRALADLSEIEALIS